MEIVRVTGAVLFWAITLPAAVVVFPLAALWHMTNTFLTRAVMSAALFRTSPISV